MAESPKPEAAPQAAVADFEKSLDELEQLVRRMEQGELTLDESLQAYERGVALYRNCQAALDQAELRVRLLGEAGDSDNATPFAPDDD